MEYIIIHSQFANTCICEPETDTFESLIEQYRDAWKDADIEKKKTGNISRKTSKRLGRIADKLNKAERM